LDLREIINARDLVVMFCLKAATLRLEEENFKLQDARQMSVRRCFDQRRLPSCRHRR
jgi:hypothetical protein